MKLKSWALVVSVLLVGGLAFTAVTRRNTYSRPGGQPPGIAQNQAPVNTEMIGVGVRHFRLGATDGNPDANLSLDPNLSPNASNPNASNPNATNPNPSPATPTQQSAAPTAVGDPVAEVIRLVNVERSQIGLPPLKENTKLSGVASTKASDMATANYFSHTSPTYGSPFDMMKRFGIDYTAAGENIAKGQTSPQQVMTSWMNSQGHRQNILDSRFTEIGVGFDSRGNYWVQQFIKP